MGACVVCVWGMICGMCRWFVCDVVCVAWYVVCMCVVCMA